MKHKDAYHFRGPYFHPTERGVDPPRYRRIVEDGIIIERDVRVPLRDGAHLYVDIFRPADEKPGPPVIGWGPYGKGAVKKPYLHFPTAGLTEKSFSKLCGFEALDPAHWVPRGYVIINADMRGTWYSEGEATFDSPEEAEDFYDLIEWAGTQPWSNGKVGLSGVSYLAVSQWQVASLNPPHLAAINPWEGWSDIYREVVRHGGIPETSFWPFLIPQWGVSTTRLEDLARTTEEHPLFDEYWQSKAAKLERIRVPAYVVASWSDHGMHSRGTMEGFKKIASERKWLEVHGRKKWAHYYDPPNVQRLQVFFDHFLKGEETEIDRWPKVRVEVRERAYVGAMQGENEWPIARTRYTRLHLDAASRTLKREPPTEVSSCRYDSRGVGAPPFRAEFTHRFDERTDLIGHMKLKLWAAAEDARDMDLFVAIQKLDANGQGVPFPFWAQFDDGPVALGWLRASHRELDEEQSTEYQPVLKHQRELKVEPGQIVPLDIEIWASGTRFEAGESLKLVVQGRDIYDYPRPTVCDRHEQTVNYGRHTLYTGGQYDSYLLVPVVPPH